MGLALPISSSVFVVADVGRRCCATWSGACKARGEESENAGEKPAIERSSKSQGRSVDQAPQWNQAQTAFLVQALADEAAGLIDPRKGVKATSSTGPKRAPCSNAQRERLLGRNVSAAVQIERPLAMAKAHEELEQESDSGGSDSETSDSGMDWDNLLSLGVSHGCDAVTSLICFCGRTWRESWPSAATRTTPGAAKAGAAEGYGLGERELCCDD